MMLPGSVVMKRGSYLGTSRMFRFSEELGSVTNQMNIASVKIRELPPNLVQINVVIGKSRMFSFDATDLADAYTNESNLLESVMVDINPILIPIADASYMIHELEFVYDHAAIGLIEEYEMVEETLRLPKFGKERYIYTGDVDDDFMECNIECGVDLTYETVKTGALTRSVTKPVVLQSPTLEFQLYRKSADKAYEVPFWQRMTVEPQDPWIPEFASNHRLTPVHHASLDLALSIQQPFEARLENIMRVTGGYAGRAYCFA